MLPLTVIGLLMPSLFANICFIQYFSMSSWPPTHCGLLIWLWLSWNFSPLGACFDLTEISGCGPCGWLHLSRTWASLRMWVESVERNRTVKGTGVGGVEADLRIKAEPKQSGIWCHLITWRPKMLSNLAPLVVSADDDWSSVSDYDLCVWWSRVQTRHHDVQTLYNSFLE
jgi:hypothetical protein